MDNDDWDPMDHATMRRRIEEGTVEEWKRVFPAEYGNIRLEAENIRLTGKDKFSLAEQKKAWMENKELGRLLKADLKLFDRTTGELLDEKPGTSLLKVPYFSDESGVFIHNGNNYTAATQARLMPGVYTRRQDNGLLEAQFNVRAGTGRVFRVGMDPEDGQFRLKTADSNLHLYSVLRDSGVSDEELAEAWGPDVLELNKSKYDSRASLKAFNKFVPRYEQDKAKDAMGRTELLLDALNKAQVAKNITNRTLAGYWKPRNLDKAGADGLRHMINAFFEKKAETTPTFNAGFDIRTLLGDKDDEGDEYQPVGLEGLLASTRKLLAVNRGLDEPDSRNIPAFTKVYTMDKLMRERIRFDEGKLRRNMLRMLAYRRNLGPLGNRSFDPYLKEIITKNPLTSPIEETNPLQLVGQQRRITHMGPGGINSSDAITPELQAVQASELGIYSLAEGPECFDGKTEVLTFNGWKPWEKVTELDRFACLINGKVKWNAASRLVCEPYSGSMILAENSRIRMLVTPGHRVLMTNTRKGDKVATAESVFGSDIRVPSLPHPDHQDWNDASIRIRKEHWSLRQFSGTVYCATVPGGFVYVRGPGHVNGFWSGNSERAGVDVRLSWGARIGKDGRIRRPMINRKTGQEEWVSPDILLDKFVKLPD